MSELNINNPFMKGKNHTSKNSMNRSFIMTYQGDNKDQPSIDISSASVHAKFNSSFLNGGKNNSNVAKTKEDN
jgi:hypothetical protein